MPFFGMILFWCGAIADIPFRWHICDGTNGTPDLVNKLIVGAGNSYAVGAEGGSLTHTHAFTSNLHGHWMTGGAHFASGSGFSNATGPNYASGTTDNGSSLPPYHALTPIMKI